MTYIHSTSTRSSWHILARVTASGWETRCGRFMDEEGPVSDRLPDGEKSCETCLRLNANDGARLDIPNDEVTG